MEKITGKNNIIVKDTKRLFSSSRVRREKQLFAIEGARLCFDVLNSFYEVATLLVTDELYEKYPDKVDSLIERSDRAFLISPEIAQRLSETQSPQGIFAVVKMQPDSREIVSGRVIALDSVQDPGNVGAIIRSAEALGIDSVLCCNSCDIFNPKAIRASMGSVLRMNIVDTDDLVSFLLGLKAKGFSVYSTVPDRSAEKISSMDFSGSSVCVIGNEANGVSDEVKQASDALVTIPMLGRAESLNASVAASITMWEMVR